ncbi:MAG: hypothetical protein LQ339_000299 [Xanthoria mediterranea]|nr:MAG: hypothetical protein LQ339_000299 [Xanthoria mediterranea]
MGPPKDLLLEGDRGDDAYGDSVVEAARHVLESCVRPASRGGFARLFSEANRLRLEFTYDGASLLHMRCGGPLPLPHARTVDDIKKKVEIAISALPTDVKPTTTYNKTRAHSRAGREVDYLLPRREPKGEPNPVLWVNKVGNQVAQCSPWDIWTAAVAVNNMCVRNGRTGLAYNLGRTQEIQVALGADYRGL